MQRTHQPNWAVIIPNKVVYTEPSYPALLRRAKTPENSLPSPPATFACDFATFIIQCNGHCVDLGTADNYCVVEMVDDDIGNCNANTKEEEEEFWSQLPFLLLWMIKDRLDFIDDVQLSAVCRHWWSASASYPKRLQSAGDRLPWIMQFSRNNFVKSGLREFICVSRRKKFTIDLPEFCNADTLFSKQGWLLLHRKNFSSDGRGGNRRLPDSVFLINPFTKAKIEMPDVESASRAQFCWIIFPHH
ncbi:F-box/kelch-repeat protein [Camellia lanceoleosa]|uniref:F-box/kelch-repeat protein n=1 Tax=Camellia lanceoleosa TaxID=1840588 RepID=A0ACC0F141_9ERIC|nr:F-box/kelch-repeat protein [Camellia lanceoleosa]